MEELNLITLNAISGYYNNLKYLGYVDYQETNNIIILSFINDLINTSINTIQYLRIDYESMEGDLNMNYNMQDCKEINEFT